MIDRLLAWLRRPRYQLDKLPDTDAREAAPFRRLTRRRPGSGAQQAVVQPSPHPEALFRAALRDMLEDRRAERKAKMSRAVVYLMVFVVPLAIYAALYAHASGFRFAPSGEVVGVVRIDGQIEPGGLASAEKVIPALSKAFESDRVKAVIISIDSGGGSPVESERIYRVIQSYKQSHPKPVVAVINNIGASAAYMIAMHCDKIVAGKYSLVGSVGAIMAGWDLHKAMQRIDISQRVYASGNLKAMLNPFIPMSAEADRKAHDLVSQLGQEFAAELSTARGPKLKANINYATGEVWGGVQAAEIGLVDEIGTLDDYIQKTWDRPMYDYGPRRAALGFSAMASQWVRETVLGRTPETISLR